MELRSVISVAGCKRLAAVDLPGRASNQHSIGAVNDLLQLFAGLDLRREPIQWRYFADNEEASADTGTITFHDSRASSAERTGRSPEWRIYYSGEFLARAEPGDPLILLRKASGELYGLVFQDGSRWLSVAKDLFNLADIPSHARALGDENLNRELEFSKRQILDEIGIEVDVPITSEIAEVAARELERAKQESRTFPTTTRMAELAQEHAEHNLEEPDDALLSLLSAEEQLFRAIEGIIVGERIKSGFETVDDFVEYSLSVQNRRKARMGYALQNHLERVFKHHKLRFDKQSRTEGKNKPDFIFPGVIEYHDAKFDSSRLLMLAAKSSCKERWRQILPEAARVAIKHLCTLEQAISIDQTNEMRVQNVVLVVPQQLQQSYQHAQRSAMLSLTGFIELVKSQQRD